MQAWHTNDEITAVGQQRRGYMGHVTEICNKLVLAKEKSVYSSLITTLFTGT